VSDDLRDLPAFDDGRTHSLPGEPEWPVREVVVEYDEGWFVGGYDRVEQPDGTEKKYYWAELSPATIVVAVADDQVLFVEQYRPTVRNTQLELPAGIVEPGESYTAAGARELAEETGFEPSSTSLLQEVWCSTGVLRHKRGYVFAEGLEPVDVDHDSNEFLVRGRSRSTRRWRSPESRRPTTRRWRGCCWPKRTAVYKGSTATVAGYL